MSYTFKQLCEDVERGAIPYEITKAAGLDPEAVGKWYRECERWEKWYQWGLIALVGSLPAGVATSFFVRSFLQDVPGLVQLLLIVAPLCAAFAFILYTGIRHDKVFPKDAWAKVSKFHEDVNDLMLLVGSPTIMIGFESIRARARDSLVQIACDKVILEEMSPMEVGALNRDNNYYSVRIYQLDKSLDKYLVLLKRLGLLRADCPRQSIVDSARAILAKAA